MDKFIEKFDWELIEVLVKKQLPITATITPVLENEGKTMQEFDIEYNTDYSFEPQDLIDFQVRVSEALGNQFAVYTRYEYKYIGLDLYSDSAIPKMSIKYNGFIPHIEKMVSNGKFYLVLTLSYRGCINSIEYDINKGD